MSNKNSEWKFVLKDGKIYHISPFKPFEYLRDGDVYNIMLFKDLPVGSHGIFLTSRGTFKKIGIHIYNNNKLTRREAYYFDDLGLAGTSDTYLNTLCVQLSKKDADRYNR